MPADRPITFANHYGTDFSPPDDDWQRQDAKLMKHPPVTLTEIQRSTVEIAIRDLCALRSYALRALNVRTNHVHFVVSAQTNRPGLLLNAFKARATAALRRKGHWPHVHSPWSGGDSKRYLWTDANLERAVDYILNGQDEDTVPPAQRTGAGRKKSDREDVS